MKKRKLKKELKLVRRHLHRIMFRPLDGIDGALKAMRDAVAHGVGVAKVVHIPQERWRNHSYGTEPGESGEHPFDPAILAGLKEPIPVDRSESKWAETVTTQEREIGELKQQLAEAHDMSNRRLQKWQEEQRVAYGLRDEITQLKGLCARAYEKAVGTPIGKLLEDRSYLWGKRTPAPPQQAVINGELHTLTGRPSDEAVAAARKPEDWVEEAS